MANCALCLENLELRVSHLVPAALYRRALDRSKKNPHPLVFSARREVQTASQATRPLLCNDCEQRFHRLGEDRTLRYAASTPTTFRLREILLTRQSYRLADDFAYFLTDGLEGVDADALAYFALSVVWRAAVCEWTIDGQRMRQLELGPYMDAFRTYLKGEAGFPNDVVVKVIVCSAAEVLLMTTMPETRRWGEYRSHFFDIPGISFMVDVGGKTPEWSRQMCVIRGKGRPIFYTDLAQDDNARAFAMLRHGRALR